jgi:hypothetical protein
MEHLVRQAIESDLEEATRGNWRELERARRRMDNLANTTSRSSGATRLKMTLICSVFATG